MSHPFEAVAPNTTWPDIASGDFYADVLRRELRAGRVRSEMSVLVVCGGRYDRDVLLACGFHDVVISNLDERVTPGALAPFTWSYQDAERLEYADESFDLVVAHSGLHHCHSPHRALCEMYRVAREAVLMFEPYDSIVARVGVRLNMGQEYEVAAVYDNGLEAGGVRNSQIPNFVYRWTEGEVRKTIHSYDPRGPQEFSFHYATRIPWQRLRLLKNRAYLAAATVALPVLRALTFVVPQLANNFAVLIRKPQSRFPWLEGAGDGEEVRVNRGWMRARYGTGVDRQQISP